MGKTRTAKSEIIWAAGFFDGEGCIWLKNNRRCLALNVSQSDLRPLDRFEEAVNLGEVKHPDRPYRRLLKSGKYGKPEYKWACYNLPGIMKTIRLLWPHLSNPKRIQIITKIDEYFLNRTKGKNKCPQAG